MLAHQLYCNSELPGNYENLRSTYCNRCHTESYVDHTEIKVLLNEPIPGRMVNGVLDHTRKPTRNTP